MVTVYDAVGSHSPQPGPRAGPEQVPVTVDGRRIPEAAIAAEMQHHPAASAGEARCQAALALIVRDLLLAEAARLGLAAAPRSDGDGRRESDEEALIRALIEREVVTPVADEASCRRYYEHNPSRFRTPDLFEVHHILLAAEPGDEQRLQAARATARRLIAQLRDAPHEFARLARQHSDCPSAAQGGALGQVAGGSTVPEFEAALAAMEEGTLGSEPVATRYGVHIVRLDRRAAGALQPFAAVRERIAGYLEAASRHRAISQYVSLLIGRADIVGIDLEGAPSPLVR